jgi:gamma-glutamyltranspeptidase/glutathione hydrolase
VIAHGIAETVRQPPLRPDANHVWRPGVMTMRDVNRYAALEREPTHSGYRGLDVYGSAPPSAGGSTVGEALNILEGFPLGSLTREHALHYFLEASRFSFADRGAWVADPDFFDVPLAGLLSDRFAAERRSLIEETAAVSPVPPGDPFPFNSFPAPAPAAVEHAPGTTTHVTVSDRDGNVVVYTFTIESVGGNGLVVPGWGFLLNNELTDFNFDSPTHPNRVEGGKRPRSSMAPTIVLDDGWPFLAVGSPGGSMIITTVLQVLIDRLDLGATLPEAIAAPRLSQRNTTTTVVEPQFLGTPEAAALEARGHVFSTMDEIGAVTGIEFLGRGRVLAAAEPSRRGGGSAMVVKPEWARPDQLLAACESPAFGWSRRHPYDSGMLQALLERASRSPHLCSGDAERQMRCDGLPGLGTNAVVRSPHDRHVVCKIRAIPLVRWQCGPGQRDRLGYRS